MHKHACCTLRWEQNGARARHDVAQLKLAGEDEETALHIANLTRNVTDGHLGEIFARYGRLKRAVVNRDPHVGMSLGTGLVEFITAREAEEAQICMDGVSAAPMRNHNHSCPTTAFLPPPLSPPTLHPLCA